MLVVDVGCKSHEAERSIEPLIRRFEPMVLYGFDPHPETQPEYTFTPSRTLLVVERSAAWLFDGEVPYTLNGTRSSVGHGPDTVPCIDLAKFLDGLLASGQSVVLKLDCEGSEYALLADLRNRDVLDRLDRVLVEWHMPCPWEPWGDR